MTRLRARSWWERDLHLARRPPVALPERVDVLIVGAGFMGRWLAHFLSRLPTPPATLVVERDAFTWGASSRNAGFLTCGQLSEMATDAEQAGLDAVIDTFLMRLRGMEIVRREFPEFVVDTAGSFDWDPLDHVRRELARTLNDAAGRDVYEVREARIGGVRRAAMFNRADGGLDPAALLLKLEGSAGAAATFAFGVEVREIGDGRAGVETPSGAGEVRYGHAFVCTNAFTSQLHPASRVQPGRGQVIVTSPVTSDAPRALGYRNRGYDYFRWVGDRLLFGGGRHLHPEENGPTELLPTEGVRRYLREAAAEVIGHDRFEVEHHWAGIMGFAGGAHLGGPPRSRIDDSAEALAGFGGMGVALTPAVAEARVRALAGPAAGRHSGRTAGSPR